ncbi:MAG: cysteine synthase family protein [Clostridiales bacterium]|nr:cysteine synthase family protein [Clostridiales bacterium]
MKRELIGDTPLVKIKASYKGITKNVYAKLEYYNYTGSIKDRMAEYILRKSYENGSFKRGMSIVEATSGNTGIAFASLGARFGHQVHIFMPDWASVERRKIMEMYGAKVYPISKEEGGFREAIRRADELSKKINGFRPQQFSNELNVLAHYNGTGEEIVKNVHNIDAFVSGFGTGGTIIGIGKKIKEKFPNAKVIAMEPKNMTLLSLDKKIGSHKIEGIGDDFLPDIVDKSIIDGNILIEDNDAIQMSKMLARKLGLGVGISSGGNFLASMLVSGENVVTVFADDFKKYLSTDLFRDGSDTESIVEQIEIHSMEVL